MAKNDKSKKIELGPVHIRAVELRLRGLAHHDIAKDKLVNKDAGTIRNWFAKGGICHDTFEEEKIKRKEEAKARLAELDERLRELAPDALVVVENKMREGKLKAALEILDRAGFGAIQKIQDVTQSELLSLLRNIAEEDKAEAKKQFDAKKPKNRQAGKHLQG